MRDSDDQPNNPHTHHGVPRMIDEPPAVREWDLTDDERELGRAEIARVRATLRHDKTDAQ